MEKEKKDISRDNYKKLVKEHSKEHYKFHLQKEYDLNPTIIRRMEIARIETNLKRYKEQGWVWLVEFAQYCLTMLNEILDEVEGKEPSQETETPTVAEKKHKLNSQQVALIRFYNKDPITSQNWREVARKYGWTSNKVYQHYTHFTTKANRTGVPTAETKRALKNKIALFESIGVHVRDQKQICDELSILKDHLKQYPEK